MAEQITLKPTSSSFSENRTADVEHELENPPTHEPHHAHGHQHHHPHQHHHLDRAHEPESGQEHHHAHHGHESHSQAEDDGETLQIHGAPQAPGAIPLSGKPRVPVSGPAKPPPPSPPPK